MTLTLALALGMAAQAVSSTPPAGYGAAEHRAWQETRLTNLRKPDGWLSLIGLVWLEPGQHSVGAGADAHYRLEAGPDRLGTLELIDSQVWFAPQDGVTATLDGTPVQERVQLVSDADGPPSRLAFGSAHFTLIDRGGRLGLRVKSSEAPVLTGFRGLTSYAYDPDWVVTARWQPFAEPRTLEIASIIGTVDTLPTPGVAVFERDGRTYTLQPTAEGDQLFFVFGDRTNGRETYGMARFLYAKASTDGQTVVLDFNRAYNPPCAFTPYATCPMPPEGNRLDLAVRAGEQKYDADAP